MDCRDRNPAEDRARGVIFALALLPARHLLSPGGPLEQKDMFPQWARDLRDLNRLIDHKRAVIFNVPKPIEAMFYTPFVAYQYLPTDADTQALKARGYGVYIFEPRTNERAPAVRRVE